MNKKASFIAGVLFVSLAVLVFFAIRSFRCPSSEVVSPTVTDETSASETITVFESDTAETQTQDETVAKAADTGSDFSDALHSSRFSVFEVVNAQTGEEISPRVALGASYSDCYLSFVDDSHFEILLSASSGSVRAGTYDLYDKTISVIYSDDKGAEYEILSDDSGSFSGVSVPYGEYNVIFR